MFVNEIRRQFSGSLNPFWPDLLMTEPTETALQKCIDEETLLVLSSHMWNVKLYRINALVIHLSWDATMQIISGWLLMFMSAFPTLWLIFCIGIVCLNDGWIKSDTNWLSWGRRRLVSTWWVINGFWVCRVKTGVWETVLTIAYSRTKGTLKSDYDWIIALNKVTPTDMILALCFHC